MTKRQQPYLTDRGQRRCLGTNAALAPCGSFALRDSDYCFVHSGRARAAQSKGGRVSRRVKRAAQLLAALYGSLEEPALELQVAPEEERGELWGFTYFRRTGPETGELVSVPEDATRYVLLTDGTKVVDAEDLELPTEAQLLRQRALWLCGRSQFGDLSERDEKFLAKLTKTAR